MCTRTERQFARDLAKVLSRLARQGRPVRTADLSGRLPPPAGQPPAPPQALVPPAGRRPT